jgi:FkbM family methyltransferase
MKLFTSKKKPSDINLLFNTKNSIELETLEDIYSLKISGTETIRIKNKSLSSILYALDYILTFDIRSFNLVIETKDSNGILNILRAIKRIQPNYKVNLFFNNGKLYFYCRIIKPKNWKNIQDWLYKKGDDTYRIEYPLNPNSIVFDVGGYIGDWAEKIYNKYECNVYVFEPVEEFYLLLLEKFKDFPKIKIYNIAVSDFDGDSNIYLDGDASSQDDYLKSSAIPIKVRSIDSVIKDLNPSHIDLIKLNIEGDEYPLLLSMIQNNILNIATNYQIQFHTFVKNHGIMKKKIAKELEKSHTKKYDFPYVWEGWTKK